MNVPAAAVLNVMVAIAVGSGVVVVGIPVLVRPLAGGRVEELAVLVVIAGALEQRLRVDQGAPQDGRGRQDD